MNNITALSIIALAALIHASFQLGVSMVTLLSGQSAGKRVAGARALALVGAFLSGTIVMTTLLISTTAFVVGSLFGTQVPVLAWTVVTALMVAIGLAVWLFYYRRGAGTSLWISRGMARFLQTRIKTTTMRSEAFSLGLTGVFTELLFIIAPVAAAACALISLPPHLQLIGVALYVIVASLGMILVTVLIGSGHSLSRIQRWREANKHFLQFAAGAGLIVLGG
jgi:hypothetical protein